MTASIDATAAARVADKAFSALHATLTGDQKQSVVDWLDALAAQQLIGMATCNPAMLAVNQLRAQQLIALTDAISTGSTTGYVF